ncbi:MAG: ArsR/SmtB family transcription factor [Akkermansiaceae bacterium]
MKIEQMTAVFQCLMDETRLRMVKLLISSRNLEHQEICVGDFVLCLGELQYNVSKQLKILEQAGVLVSRKQGRKVYFKLARGVLVEEIFGVIADVADSGRVFATDFKKYQKLTESTEPQQTKKNPEKRLKRAPRKESQKEQATFLVDDELPSNLL